MPKTFVSGKIHAIYPYDLDKNEKSKFGFHYLEAGVPVKYNYLETDKNHALAMLYSADFSLNTISSGEADNYKSNATKNNLSIPIIINKKNYHKFIYKRIICFGKVEQLENDLLTRLSLSKDMLVTDLNMAFFNPFQMNIHQIYIYNYQIKELKKEIEKETTFSYCIELKIKNEIKQEKIQEDLRSILHEYQNDKYRVNFLHFPQGGGTRFAVWKSVVYINIVKNYIGFYVDLTLNDIEKTIKNKKELSKIVKTYMQNTKLEYEVSYISDTYLI